MRIEFVGGKFDGLKGDMPTNTLKPEFTLVDLRSNERYNYVGYVEEDGPMIMYLFEPIHFSVGAGALWDD